MWNTEPKTLEEIMSKIPQWDENSSDDTLMQVLYYSTLAARALDRKAEVRDYYGKEWDSEENK